MKNLHNNRASLLAQNSFKSNKLIHILFLSNFMIRCIPFCSFHPIISDEKVFLIVALLDIINLFIYKANKNDTKRIIKIHTLTLVQASMLCTAYLYLQDHPWELSQIEEIPQHLLAIIAFLITTSLITTIYAIIAILKVYIIIYLLIIAFTYCYLKCIKNTKLNT